MSRRKNDNDNDTGVSQSAKGDEASVGAGDFDKETEERRTKRKKELDEQLEDRELKILDIDTLEHEKNEDSDIMYKPLGFGDFDDILSTSWKRKDEVLIFMVSKKMGLDYIS
ncbi:hypothetical protein L1987_23166 [Smallanthus sonchifolius]|uniref:Uncharacterized protein n=1 Tax=Smallanthus sonchifolius TaxID=185202 RepID=A0ACB9IIC7_9ASTR|nr:hypothetical protein L1987_23166 [Smallanthus sonchifolius]